MRIFITGMGGFIGKNLITKFSKKDKILSLSRTNYKDINLTNIQYITGDISKPKNWIDKVKSFNPDCCIHLAWDGIPNFSLSKCRENINSNLIFLESLIQIGIPNLIFAGSCWEYGYCNGEINEEYNSNKTSIFGLSKLTILSFLENLALDFNFNYKWARIFFAYGPHQKKQSLICSIWNDIHNSEANNIKNPYAAQDFIYIDDVCRGILKLTDKNVKSGIYNIGSNKLTCIAEIANIIYSHYGLKIPYPNIKNKFVEGFWANNTKLTNLGDFNLKYSIKDGIIKTLNFLDN